MANKGILSKNYYIDPVAVSDFGADVYNVMAEADRAMEEASQIIAEIASLTERVPGEIRCGALQEACATAQAEIKSVDFLSYGQRVDQGLQNLLDHNQYITDHFIKNMGMHTERMRGLGEEFRRLADLITYSGEGVQAKGIKFFTDGNLETTNVDSEEENLPNQGNEEETELDMTGWGGMFPCAGAAAALEVDRDEVMADARYLRNLKYGQNVLTNYMLNHGIGNDEEIKDFIDCITERRPGLLIELFVVDSNSSRDVYDKIFNEINNVQKEQGNSNAYMEIYDKYRMNLAIGILEEHLAQCTNDEYSDPDNWERIEDILQRHAQRMLINLYETQGVEGKAGVFRQLMNIYEQYKWEITIEDVDTLVFTDSEGTVIPLNDLQKETFVACWNMLVSMEVDEMHIIAVMANIYAESGYSATNAYIEKYPDLDDFGKYVFDSNDNIAFGIIQWLLAERKQALSDYADRTRGSVYDLETQLGYFQYEMTDPNGICVTNWPNFLDKIDLDEAVEYFCCKIEIAGSSTLNQRQNYAKTIEEWYNNLDN